MTRYLQLYGLFLLQRFKILMEYRVNFLIGASSTIFLQAASLLTLWVIMSQVPTLVGWSFEEVLLIYGMVTLAKSLNHMFADNLWTIGHAYIRTGEFDRFLVRPIDPLFHLLADRFNHDGIGNFLVGVALVIHSSLALNIPWTMLNIFYLMVMVLSGGVIFIALNLIACVSAFWIMDPVPVIRLIFDQHLFAQYPLSIYPRAIGIWLTWIVPYGFASFYPASYLLGRQVGLLAFISPLLAALLLWIAYSFWRYGLRHYSSTGS